MKKFNFDFIAKRKVFFAIPIIIAVITIITALVAGVPVDIEFKGGTMLTYSYAGDIDTKAVQATVEGMNLGTVGVTTGSAFGTDLETVQISFSSDEGLTAEVQASVTDTLVAAYPDNTLELVNSQDVNPSSGFSFFLKCFVAVIFSFVLLVIYIAFRFKNIGGWSAGVFAIVALAHDVFMVFASFVFLRLPIDANFMAVILTILGYSINSTIVMFDRVRENRKLYGNKFTIPELVNVSINQTLGRSIKTTITTGIAVLSMCIVALICGVESIVSFVFPLFVGLLAGAYSSIFISGPLWAMWKTRPQADTKKSK
ncbi:MAG: protein translocase subunit SecF [Oscillospiraceae bacterium]|nr:protein translocase subunit SecF [Oscillospiraceae bacterium]